MSIVSTNVSELVKKTEHLFSDAAIPSPRLDAEVLLAHVLGVDRSWLVAHGDEELESEQVRKFESLVARRLKREPVAYITGKKEFYGREFMVTQDVLIPRPETEDLVELFFELGSMEVRKLGSQEASSRQQAADRKQQEKAAPASEPDTTSAIHLQPETALLRTQGGPGAKPWSGSMYPASKKKHRVLDVGCGSGCIGITLKLERPEFDVTLADISPKALAIAKNNAKCLHAKVNFAQSDLLSNFPTSQLSNFDLIVANLPYVDTSWKRSPETDHEPALALFADDNGLELIKRLIEQSTTVLADNGLLFLEADPCQHNDIITYGERYGFVHAKTLDYAIALQKVA